MQMYADSRYYYFIFKNLSGHVLNDNDKCYNMLLWSKSIDGFSLFRQDTCFCCFVAFFSCLLLYAT